MKANLIYLKLNFKVIVVSNLKWLPPKLNLENFSDINAFIKHLYIIFEEDFKNNEPVFFGNKPIQINNLPLHRRCEKLLKKGLTCNNQYNCNNCIFVDKEDIFNHITCREQNEEIRTPGIFEEERASRLPWIRHIIENCNDEHPSIKYYETIVRGNLKKCFWLEIEKFLVILTEDDKGRLYLTSAYYLYNRKSSDRPRRDYKNFCKQQKRTL